MGRPPEETREKMDWPPRLVCKASQALAVTLPLACSSLLYMAKIKGKFSTKVTVVTDPFVVEFCAQHPEPQLSRKDKVRLFNVYHKAYTSLDSDMEKDKKRYAKKGLVSIVQWPLRLGLYGGLGGFYWWFGSWLGLPRPLGLLCIPLSVVSFSYLDYRMDMNEYYKIAEKNEPQMKKWLCAHTQSLVK